MLDGGASPSVVQKQMRHSDARITLGIYGHVVGDAQRLWDVGGHRRRTPEREVRRRKFSHGSGLVCVVLEKSARWYNIIMEKKKHPELFREDLSRLLAMLQEKSIRPIVAERLPLRGAGRAHELLERASVSGKIVLMCQE